MVKPICNHQRVTTMSQRWWLQIGFACPHNGIWTTNVSQLCRNKIPLWGHAKKFNISPFHPSLLPLSSSVIVSATVTSRYILTRTHPLLPLWPSFHRAPSPLPLFACGRFSFIIIAVIITTWIIEYLIFIASYHIPVTIFHDNLLIFFDIYFNSNEQES